MSSPSYLAQWERAAAQGVIFSQRDTISLSDILKWVGFFAPGVVQKVGNERFTCVVPSIFTKNFNT